MLTITPTRRRAQRRASCCEIQVVPSPFRGASSWPNSIGPDQIRPCGTPQLRREVPQEDISRDGHYQATLEVPSVLQARQVVHAEVRMVWEAMARRHGLHFSSRLWPSTTTGSWTSDVAPRRSRQCAGTPAAFSQQHMAPPPPPPIPQGPMTAPDQFWL